MPIRLGWLDAAKAIAIVLVVLVHAATWLRFAGVDSDAIREVNRAFDSMRMPVFFIASGLFASRWLQQPWAQLWTRKLRPLVWLFVVWQPAVFAYKMAAAASLPGQTDTSLAAHVARAVLSPIRPNGELWFLWALALAFVLAKATAGRRVRAQLLASAAVALLWTGVVAPALGKDVTRLIGDGWSGLASYYVFFVAAVYGRELILTAVARITTAHAVLAVVAWALVSWLVVGSDVDRLAPIVTVPFQTLGVVAALSAATLLRRVPGVVALGRHTLEVFVAHTVFIVAAAIGLHAAGAAVEGPVAALVVLAVTAAAVAASLVLRRLLDEAGARVLYEAPETTKRPLARPGG